MRRSLLAIALLAGCASRGLAQEVAAPSGVEPSGSFSLLRIFVALLVTLAAILLLAALLKRSPLGASRSGGDLRVETRLTITRGGQVAVVRVDGRRILLGITPSQVNLLAELREGDAPTPADPGAFERLVSGMLGRREAAR